MNTLTDAVFYSRQVHSKYLVNVASVCTYSTKTTLSELYVCFHSLKGQCFILPYNDIMFFSGISFPLNSKAPIVTIAFVSPIIFPYMFQSKEWCIFFSLKFWHRNLVRTERDTMNNSLKFF
jgi:hypothetical protein